MTRTPSAVWIVDTNKEHIAVDEARKLDIPVVAILDTNCDPDVVDYKIPGNDDAIRSIRSLTRVIADAVAEGLMARAGATPTPTASPRPASWPPTSRSPSGRPSCSPVRPPRSRRERRPAGHRRRRHRRRPRPPPRPRPPRPRPPPPAESAAAAVVRPYDRRRRRRPPPAPPSHVHPHQETRIMATITAADIKKLREVTGAGMIDCKNALVEADGDFDKAVEQLRVKGLKGVAKREGRAASNGLVAAKLDGTTQGVLLELNCETDFVAKGERVPGGRARPSSTRAFGSNDADRERPRSTAGRSTGRARRGQRLARREDRGPSLRDLRRRAYVAIYLHKTSPDLPPQVGVLVELDRRRRRGRQGRRAAHRGVLPRSTSRATRSPTTSSTTSARSPRRRPRRRASPRRPSRRSSRVASTASSRRTCCSSRRSRRTTRRPWQGPRGGRRAPSPASPASGRPGLDSRFCDRPARRRTARREAAPR